MDFKEKNLIKMLDDNDVKSKIIEIVKKNISQIFLDNTQPSGTIEEKTGFLEKRKVASLESRVKNLTQQLDSANQDITRYRSAYQEANSNLEKYKSAYTETQNELKKAITERDKLFDKIDELNADLEKIQNINDTLKSKYDTVKSELQNLKNQFNKPTDYLEQYRTLSSTIRTGLSDIICDKNEILFISSCTSAEHLKAIWGYTKQLVYNDGNKNEIDILKNIFDYFFDVFNESLSKPIYERDDVEVGYYFDDDCYDRFSGSKTSGDISEIILRGYRSISTENIICRSVVKV